MVASAPELSVGGEGAFRTGLVTSAPELSIGGEERVGRGWLRWSRNYPSGERAGCVCGGVAGSPSVDTLSEGDDPSSPELTVGADGDAVDWNAPRRVTYGRRGGI